MMGCRSGGDRRQRQGCPPPDGTGGGIGVLQMACCMCACVQWGDGKGRCMGMGGVLCVGARCGGVDAVGAREQAVKTVPVVRCGGGRKSNKLGPQKPT